MREYRKEILAPMEMRGRGRKPADLVRALLDWRPIPGNPVAPIIAVNPGGISGTPDRFTVEVQIVADPIWLELLDIDAEWLRCAVADATRPVVDSRVGLKFSVVEREGALNSKEYPEVKRDPGLSESVIGMMPEAIDRIFSHPESVPRSVLDAVEVVRERLQGEEKCKMCAVRDECFKRLLKGAVGSVVGGFGPGR
jgi:hypothetical protein